MAAGSTYTKLATTTLGSSSTTVSFNSFSGYTDLVCIYSVRNTSGASQDVYLQFNGDTNTNYSASLLYSNGTTAGSYRATNDSGILLDYYGSAGPTSGPYNTGILNIMNYSNGNTFKATINRAGRSNNGVDESIGLWRSLSAITSITFKLSASNQFASGSVFSLYGIAAA